MFEKRRSYGEDADDAKTGKADRKHQSRKDRQKVRNLLDRVAKGQINVEDLEDLDDI